MVRQAHRLWQGLKETDSSILLFLLLATDGMFILLHFLRLLPILDTPLLALDKDLGYPEFYQYTKEFWVVLLLLALRSKTKANGYALWALLFLYILLDDALQIHESVGVYTASILKSGTFLGLRMEDIGELAVYGLVALIFFGSMYFVYLHSSAAYQQATRHLLLLLFLFALFGVVVDMALIILALDWKVDYIAVAIEDGGEMIVMSAIVWYTYLLYLGNGVMGGSLRNL
ncbi:MAG: hypothetical protein R2867_41220 [Caldilineaceae bacterium]